MRPGIYMTNGAAIKGLQEWISTGRWEDLVGDLEAQRLDVRSAFTYQGWFRRCVDVRASALASIPWRVRRPTSETALWSSDDVRGSKAPPPGLEWAGSLPIDLYAFEAALAIVGRSYSLKERERGRLTGLLWFNPLTVRPLKDKDRGVYAYRRMVNGAPEDWPVEHVLAIHAPDPFVGANLPGSSDGAAARIHADVLQSIAEFLDKHFDRGLTLATILTVPPDAPAKEKRRLEEWWNRFISGKKNTGRARVISSDVVPTVVGEGLKDLANKQLTEHEREGISTAFGVPHSIVMSNAANFATAQADQLAFYIFKVFWQMRLVEHHLNAQLFNPEGLHFEFMPERLEVVQAYELQKAESVAKLTGRPVLTVNEGREMLGKDPVDGGDELHVPAPPAVGGAAPAAGADGAAPKPKPKPGGGRQRVNADEEADAEAKAVDALAGMLAEIEAREAKAVRRRAAREDEVKAWRRKVRRHGRAVKFDAERLRPAEAREIERRLLSGLPLERVFREPFRGPAVHGAKALAAEPEYTLAAATLDYQPFDLADEGVKGLVWKAVDRMRAEHVRATEERFERAITAQVEAVAAAWSRLGRREADQLDDVAEIVMASKTWAGALEEPYRETYREVGLAFARSTVVAGKAGSFALKAEEGEEGGDEEGLEAGWEAVVAALLAAILGRRRERVNRTTGRMILALAAEAAELGWSPARATTELRRRWKALAAGRTARIAVTEVVGASNAGAEYGAGRAGVPVEKKWENPLDRRERQWHHTAATEHPWIPVGTDFTVGGEAMARPGDPRGSAPNVINCRCWLSFRRMPMPDDKKPKRPKREAA